MISSSLELAGRNNLHILDEIISENPFPLFPLSLFDFYFSPFRGRIWSKVRYRERWSRSDRNVDLHLVGSWFGSISDLIGHGLQGMSVISTVLRKLIPRNSVNHHPLRNMINLASRRLFSKLLSWSSRAAYRILQTSWKSVSSWRSITIFWPRP